MQIELLAPDVSLMRCGNEIALFVVVTQLPMLAFRRGLDRSEGIKRFEQANILLSVALEYRNTVIGYDRINGNAFVVIGSGKKEDSGDRENRHEAQNPSCRVSVGALISPLHKSGNETADGLAMVSYLRDDLPVPARRLPTNSKYMKITLLDFDCAAKASIYESPNVP
jgi:hypothetical protein